MRLSYHNMEIDISLEGLLEVENLEWHEALNQHGMVKIRFLAEEEKIENILFRLERAAEIAIFEKTVDGTPRRTFCGRSVNIRGRKERGLFFVWTEFASYTKEWDLTPKSQSFCLVEQSYGTVIREVIREYPRKDIKDEITNGKKIGNMLLQYEETDWEFLERLASHFSSFLVADSASDCGRVFFGLPNLDHGISLQYGEYQISQNQEEYDKICSSRKGYVVTDLMPQEVTRWSIRCRRRLQLAETLRFHGIETVVSEVRFHTEKGELIREYTLGRKKGMLSERKKNPRIFGMSIPATVKERSGNRIRVQMDIDRKYRSGVDCKYFTYAIESSSIYCMPEENSRVHIYFPSHDEADAIAVHAISMGGGAGRNPADKSFSTPAKMSMQMKPNSYNFDAGGSSLSIGIDGIFKLTGKTIQFITQEEFSVGKETQPDNILAEAENEMHLHVGDTSITMTEDTDIVSAFIAHAATKKTTPFPSAESIETDVKANDENILSSYNQGAEGHLGSLANERIYERALAEKKAQAEQQIQKGIFGLVGTLLTVGVVVATGGIAVPAVAAVAALLTANEIMFSVADIHQGITDYKKAEEGDLSPTENFFQSALNMNDEQYENFKFYNGIFFDVVMMTATSVNVSNMFGNISNCAVKKLARGLTMFSVRGGQSILSQLETTGRVDLFTLAVDSAIGCISAVAGGTVGAYSAAGVGKLGASFGLGTSSGLSQMLQFGTKIFAGGTFAGLSDIALHLPLMEEKPTSEDLWKTVQAYILGMGASELTMAALNPGLINVDDPVNAITGAYLATETDMALAGIRSALLMERKYDSLRKRSGILGKGWYSPWEGRLCREENGRLQVEIPAGMLLLFEQVDGHYEEAGEVRGRYSLTADSLGKKWVLSDSHTHEKLEYDQEGRLTAMVDKNSQRTTLHYEKDHLTRLVTPLGHQLQFCFQEGLLVQATDDIGRTVRYHYEGGLLTEVVNPAGGSIRYQYSDEGKLITASDCAGSAYLVNEYDRQGRVTRQILGGQEVDALEYRDDRQETVTRNQYGTVVFQYNRMKLPVRILYPDGTDMCFQYDENHRCVYRKDRRGHENFFSYDEKARVIRHKKANSLEICYEYDENGDKVREWDNAGQDTRYVYDRSHLLIERREKRERSGNRWNVTAYAYDSLGRLIKQTSPAGKSVSYAYGEGCGKPTSTTYGDGETVLREYDTMERMMAKEDSCGRTEYGYNTRDEISLIRDGEGNETIKRYDSLGRLTAIYPPNADIQTGEGAIRFHYNFMRRQDDIIYPDGSHERKNVDWEGAVLKKIHPNAYDPVRDRGEGEVYDYDWDKNLIRIHYPDGGVERFFRDGNGNCIKHVLPEDYDAAVDDGPGYRYCYDEENRLTEVTGPDGTKLAWYAYDLHGNVTAAGTADGSVSRYWYDLSGNLLEKAEPVPEENGRGLFCRTSYTYDEDGRQTEICFDGGKWILVEDGTEKKLEEAEPGKSLRLSCSYDARGRLVQVTDGNGACVRYAYDVRGNRIKEEQIISEEITRVIQSRYDRAGRLSEKQELIAGWDGEGPGKTVQTAVTAYRRDAGGNITEIRTPEGYQIFREYDLRDRLICERMVDEKNGIDRSTLVSYDCAGNVVSLRRKGADGRETEINCRYDLKDRLIQARSMEGAVFEYSYDLSDRLVEEKRSFADHALGTGTWNYRYDCMGRLTERRNPDGQLEEWNQYDDLGRRTVRKLADGEEFHFYYEARGLLSGVASAGNSEKGRKLQKYRYNSRGQVIGIVDGNENQTGFDLDAWGKLMKIRAADGGVEEYTYDHAGNITSTTDANGGTIHYRYNSQGKICEITDQEGMKERFCYDREGRQIFSVDRLGNQVKTEYNIDGNPVKRISCDKDGKNREVRIWEYDCLGYLRQAVGGGFRYRYEFRPDGKLLRKETSGHAVLRYTYFPDGNIKTMTDGSGRVLSYGYDHGGRLTSVADEDGEIVSYRHTPGGKVKEIRHRNGVKTAYEYDTEGNIVRLLTETGNGKTICDLQYEYDPNGNRTVRRGTMMLPDHSSGCSLQIRDIRYRYDRMNRLTAESRNGEETSYIYDLCGNRLEKRKGGKTEKNRYNRKNQLIRRAAGGEVWDYTFDPQGNLIREAGPKEERQYLYDTENRQIRILSGGKEIQENRYDGEGLRAGLTVNGKKSTFLYVNRELYTESDETGTDISRYIRGKGLAGLEYQGRLYGVHQDEQLSTGWVTGEDGVPENAYEYDAFGTILGKHENVSNRLLYGGQQYDAETEQYYLRARYYNPVIGRYMQEDTYRGDGLNLYAYCANNPVMYYDPSGRNGVSCNTNTDAEKNAQQENVTVDENYEAGTEGTNWKGFSSEKNPETGLTKLQEHYDKHVIKGQEFGDISQTDYLKMAKAFAKESNPNFMQAKVGNIVIKYDPETRRLFVGNIKSRQIRTFYKADYRSPDPFTAAIEEAVSKTSN